MKALRIRRCLWAVVIVAFGCTAVVALAACGGGDATAELDGTSWRLAGWGDDSLDPAKFTITASFADGVVSGTSAVNSYSASYTTGPDGEFSTGEIASTTMAGPEDAMRAEQVYDELLGAAASYELAGDTLTLFDEFGDAALVFAPASQ